MICCRTCAESSHGVGLTPFHRASRRRYGPNALTPPKKPSFFMKLWAQMNNVMIWILLSSTVVVAALQQWIEMGECMSEKEHICLIPAPFASTFIFPP